MSKINYVGEELLNEFSSEQLDILMSNISIISPIDGCVSPCKLCAFDTPKQINNIMELSFLERILKKYAPVLKKKMFHEYAMDPFSYKDSKNNNLFNLMEIYDQYLNKFPCLKTAMPKGSEELILDITNNYNYSKNKFEITISRHIYNSKIVDDFIEKISHLNNYEYSKENKGKFILNTKKHFLNTDLGKRSILVKDIMPLPIGAAKNKKFTYENKGDVLLYQYSINKGVALLPTGFYNYNPAKPEVQETLKNKITKKTFNPFLYTKQKTSASLYEIDKNKINTFLY